MAELTSAERVLRVLRRQEPDRVPHFEWVIDRKVRHALCPGSPSYNEFAMQMGLDAVLADPTFSKEAVGPGRWQSEWGYITQSTAEEHGIEVESPIKTMDDFVQYTPPDLHAAGRYAAIEKTVQDYPDKAVIVHLNDVFSLPRYWMGMENLLLAIAAEPELVMNLVDLSVRLNLEMAREVAARGVSSVSTSRAKSTSQMPLWRRSTAHGTKFTNSFIRFSGRSIICSTISSDSKQRKPNYEPARTACPRAESTRRNPHLVSR